MPRGSDHYNNVATCSVGGHSACRMTMTRICRTLIEVAEALLSYLLRILKPFGCARCTAARLGLGSLGLRRRHTTRSAAWRGVGEPGAETAFRDGYLRHNDLRKPLTSKLRARCLKCGLFRDAVEFCSRLVNLVVCVVRHGGGRHRLTLAGERFVGLVT